MTDSKMVDSLRTSYYNFGMLENIRNSHKGRLWIIGGLIVLCVVLFYFAKTTTVKVILGAVIALLLAAFGMEATQNDYDMGTLMETKSFAAAKIERDQQTGNIINVDTFCGSTEIDYNCSDFKTQAEAMTVYKRCGELGKNMDVFRLDGDKDGLVCESLPAGN
jgi:hypothetical protein